MDKVKNLQGKAKALRALLEQYAKTDQDVEMVLNFMLPLFVAIDEEKIVPPHEHKYRWNFASTESPLYRKYDDLSHASSEYACALEDWESQAWFKQLKSSE
jgi:hypothetical protein